MALDYGLLRTTHRLLKQITDIRERMDRGPRKIKLVTANEASFLADLEQAKESVKKTRLAINAKQLQLDEREAKIQDMKVRLNTCDTNKEFQLLKERVAADEQANSVQQDEILEMLERLDTLIEKGATAKLNYEKSQQETKKTTNEIELEMQVLESELARVSATLAETEKKLPGDMLVEYRRKVKGMGEDVLGSTDTENCGNCYQKLTTQMVADLMMKRAVFCQGCGCILYIAEGHPAA